MTAKFNVLVKFDFPDKFLVQDVLPVSVEVHCPSCGYLSLIDMKGCKSSKDEESKCGEFSFVSFCSNRECRETLFVKTFYSYSSLNLNKILNEKLLPYSPNVKVERDIAQITIEGNIIQIYPEKEDDVITIADEIPEKYRQDFLETQKVLPISPNASALLSRRLLQRVIRDKIVEEGALDKYFQKLNSKRKKQSNHSDLWQEVDYFIDDLDIIDSKLRKEIKRRSNLIRKLGNIGAHPGFNTEQNDLENTEQNDLNEVVNVVNVDYLEAKLIIKLLDSFFYVLFLETAELKQISDAIEEKEKKSKSV